MNSSLFNQAVVVLEHEQRTVSLLTFSYMVCKDCGSCSSPEGLSKEKETALACSAAGNQGVREWVGGTFVTARFCYPRLKPLLLKQYQLLFSQYLDLNSASCRIQQPKLQRNGDGRRETKRQIYMPET